jgi:hypothetical protein
MNNPLETSSYRRIKHRVFSILEGDVSDPASRFCEIFIALLVVLNVLAIILESVPDIHEAVGDYFHYFDLFSVGIFSIEYVLRVWSYSEKYTDAEDSPWKGRKEYMFSFFGLVDFFSTVPFYLQLLMPGTDLRVLAHVSFAASSNSRATTVPWTICLKPSKPKKTLFLLLCFCSSSVACFFRHSFTSLRVMINPTFSPLFPLPCIGLF